MLCLCSALCNLLQNKTKIHCYYSFLGRLALPLVLACTGGLDKWKKCVWVSRTPIAAKINHVVPLPPKLNLNYVMCICIQHSKYQIRNWKCQRCSRVLCNISAAICDNCYNLNVTDTNQKLTYLNNWTTLWRYCMLPPSRMRHMVIWSSIFNINIRSTWPPPWHEVIIETHLWVFLFCYF